MSKYKAKTTQTKSDVYDFINTVPDLQKQKDCQAIIDIMQKQSGFEPRMWGPSIVGFGSYHYVYESGHEGDAPVIAFSPRKAEISFYLSSKFDQRQELLKLFGKHKSAKACIYIKKLEDVNKDVLKKMIKNSLQYTKSCLGKNVKSISPC